MMFGTRERFDYLECVDCGSLELLDAPADLSPFYPPDYYSFTPLPADQRKGRLHAARGLRVRIALRSRRFASITYRNGEPSWLRWFRGLGLPQSVLDVGCGSGQLLLNLRQEGFSCLTGCDPYLENEPDNGELRLVKADPGELEDSFEVVMAHHSFEHMPDPHRAMRTLRRLALKRIVISVPVPGFAWREYGVNWRALDPPRHLHILSPEGMRRVAEAHDLRITDWYCDSGPIQFWLSEQYAADRYPLYHSMGPSYDALESEQRANYARRARELNEAGDGDTAVFVLEPA
jgi:SAM-dependent methyltransferase